MDPISQGSLGAVLPQAVLTHRKLGYLALCGAVAGMVPDLDIFITSDADPLLYLEYHRQFTHALIFIPFGALIVATVLYPFLPKSLSFKHIYLACLLGYATHGFLDACTSYGTQLFWPFTDYRVAWNNVSVVDPTFTIPLLLLVIAAVIWRKRWLPLVGLTWVVLYLGTGLVQSQRALAGAEALATERGHDAARLTIKPSFANLLLWRSIYEYDEDFYVDAIRVGLFDDTSKCGEGKTIAKLNIDEQLPWLKPSQQLTDIERFSWFSQDYVAIAPSVPNRIIDVRYSLVPNEMAPLWGIDLDPTKSPQAHVEFRNLQRISEDQMAIFRDYLVGDGCVTIKSL